MKVRTCRTRMASGARRDTGWPLAARIRPAMRIAARRGSTFGTAKVKTRWRTTAMKDREANSCAYWRSVPGGSVRLGLCYMQTVKTLMVVGHSVTRKHTVAAQPLCSQAGPLRMVG